jgi:hypothetical protein
MAHTTKPAKGKAKTGKAPKVTVKVTKKKA